MAFHPSKCVSLSITRRRSPYHFQYSIKGCLLESVDTAPYLGLTLDNKLNWNPHVDKMCSKATRSLNFIRRNLRTTSPSVKETAYNSLVRPQLEYASSVWDPHLSGQTRKIEMIQRRAARFTTGRYHNTSSVSDMLLSLGWETLAQRRLKSRLTLTYKILHHLVAIPITPYFVKQDSDNYTRRNHGLTLRQTFPATDYMKATFFVAVVRPWNALPQYIAEAGSLDQFKSRLCKYELP